MQILKLNLSQVISWQKGQKIAIDEEKKIELALDLTCKVLSAGGLVVYPTETVYGMGVDAENEEAVKKLLSYKGRREGKPLSIAVADQQMAEKYVSLNQQAINFYKKFLPGPYTVISQGKQLVAKGVESEFSTLGIRLPDFKLVRAIVKKYGRAITSTSANASNKKRPYSVNDLLNNLSPRQKSLIDLIIDVGPLAKNEPSTIVDTSLSTPLTLRGNNQGLETEKNKNAQVFFSAAESDTKALAGRLLFKNWSKLEKGAVIFALNGELGMGKTIFAKGIAEYLGIKEIISSPTYSYLNEYSYQKQGKSGFFYHLDAWKIDVQKEVELLGISNLLKANNIMVIEWWQQIAKFLPDNIKKQAIILNFNDHNQKRKIEIIE